MADFPGEIYEARETENLPGIVFDAGNKRNMFSEDFQGLGAEITSIETLFKLFVDFIKVASDGKVAFGANEAQYSKFLLGDDDYDFGFDGPFALFSHKSGEQYGGWGVATSSDDWFLLYTDAVLPEVGWAGGGIFDTMNVYFNKFSVAPGGGAHIGLNKAPSTTSAVSIGGLPTSSAGLTTGDLWVDTTGGLNVLKIK